DTRGDGRQALFASYGEYADLFNSSGPPVSRVASLGYATAIGNSGSARIDYLRRVDSDHSFDQLELDTRYRLFDRFEAGASYSHSDYFYSTYRHRGTAWLGATFPLGSHELGATLLEHGESIFGWTTDLALRYA